MNYRGQDTPNDANKMHDQEPIFQQSSNFWLYDHCIELGCAGLGLRHFFHLWKFIARFWHSSDNYYLVNWTNSRCATCYAKVYRDNTMDKNLSLQYLKNNTRVGICLLWILFLALLGSFNLYSTEFDIKLALKLHLVSIFKIKFLIAIQQEKRIIDILMQLFSSNFFGS